MRDHAKLALKMVAQVKLTFDEPEPGVTVVKLIHSDVPEEDRLVFLIVMLMIDIFIPVQISISISDSVLLLICSSFCLNQIWKRNCSGEHREGLAGSYLPQDQSSVWVWNMIGYYLTYNRVQSFGFLKLIICKSS